MTGTERKTFQKYYPPDFDPSKIPKAKGGRNRQFVQRVMAPFNMQCNKCNEYIYKGKKFNMRRETAEGESYLGMKIFRFYFRCPNCLGEITFKTDIENVDYKAEHGATRLFDAFKSYQEQEREKEQIEEEEKTDAMKMLEKRTKMSRREMDDLGKIEELQEVNRRSEKVNALNYLENIDKQIALTAAEQIKLQEEEDEREIRYLMGKTENGKFARRIEDGCDLDMPSSSKQLPQQGVSFNKQSSLKVSSFLKKPITNEAVVSCHSLASKKAKPNFMKGVVIKKKTT